ncbi:MAG TPA: hypothetical protein PK536_09645 [Ignavibacteria bacterium]|nr:hypothetical protein [Ignavibacteria bacterium]HRJ99930.1 hypothetical protein [Ignavibacteria bacterium]
MDKKEKLKVILIIVLGILLIIFALLLLFSEEKDEPALTQSSKKEITPDVFKKDIDSILQSFGIKEEWKIKTDINSKEGYTFTESVLIPADIQTINLNFDLSEYFAKNDFTSVTTEDAKTKNIIMEIFRIKDSVRTKYAKLNFIYSQKAVRNVSEVCIVLDSVEYIDFFDAGKILNSTEKVSVFLPTGNDKADYQSMIADNNKNYLLKFFVGGSNDITSDFNSDMKESLLKQRIRSVSLSYPNASGIVLYYTKDRSEFAEKIKSEFRKNNMQVFSDTLFTEIRADENKVSRLFSEIKKESEKGNRLQFYIVSFSGKDFEEYMKRIPELKKPGIKFLTANDAAGKLKNLFNEKDRDTVSVK